MTCDLQRANVWKRISAFLFDVILLAIACVVCAWGFSALLGFDAQYQTLMTRYQATADACGLDMSVMTQTYNTLTDAQRTLVEQANAMLAADETAIHAYGMVFAAMFNIIGMPHMERLIQTKGIVNNVIEFFGGHYVNWINQGSEYWANMFVMIVYIVWNALPFKILVLLGGLQGINKQYYDAAKVDSTPRWRVFTKITVPLLSPMIAYVVITGFIGGFKEYTSIVGIFGETMGPAGDAGRMNTIVGMIYDALPKSNYGVASAAALILFAIIFVVTMINMQVSKKRVHY